MKMLTPLCDEIGRAALSRSLCNIMVRALLITVFSALTWTWATAQTSVYHAFPDSNAVWGIASGCNVDMNCVSGQYVQNYYAGDTLIDGLKYKIIHEAVSAISGPCCGVPLDLGAGYLRDDTVAHKVYWRIPGMALDTLLYDFTLQIGDTLGGLYGNTGLCAQDVFTVQSIDSILVGGSYRKKINFFGDQCNQTAIIEGLGSTTGLTACYVWPTTFGMLLTCFMVDGELLYTAPCGAPDLIACGELPLGIAANGQSRKPDVAALPNPSSGHFTLAANALSITIYDVPGKQLFQTTGHEIDLTAYPQGIYTAVVQTAKGRSVLRLVVVR